MKKNFHSKYTPNTADHYTKHCCFILYKNGWERHQPFVGVKFDPYRRKGLKNGENTLDILHLVRVCKFLLERPFHGRFRIIRLFSTVSYLMLCLFISSIQCGGSGAGGAGWCYCTTRYVITSGL